MARTDPELPVLLPLHLRWTAGSPSLSLHCQTKTFRNTLILFGEDANCTQTLAVFLCARKQMHMYTLERERERERETDARSQPENEKKVAQTRERLRERALPRCRDLALGETKVVHI